MRSRCIRTRKHRSCPLGTATRDWVPSDRSPQALRSLQTCDKTNHANAAHVCWFECNREELSRRWPNSHAAAYTPKCRHCHVQGIGEKTHQSHTATIPLSFLPAIFAGIKPPETNVGVRLPPSLLTQPAQWHPKHNHSAHCLSNVLHSIRILGKHENLRTSRFLCCLAVDRSSLFHLQSVSESPYSPTAKA